MSNIQDLQIQMNELNEMVKDINDQFSDVLHNHNGFGSSKIRIEDLDTITQIQTTINPSNLADGVGETHQVTGVTGAVLGDFVVISAPYDLQDLTVTAYVQANNTVEIRIQNETGGAVDLASGTWRVLLIKKII